MNTNSMYNAQHPNNIPEMTHTVFIAYTMASFVRYMSVAYVVISPLSQTKKKSHKKFMEKFAHDSFTESPCF